MEQRIGTRTFIARLSSSVALLAAMVCANAESASKPRPRENNSNRKITTLIYECEVAGHRVFSDQPCGDDAKQREVRSANSMDAYEVDTGKKSTATATNRTKYAKDDVVEAARKKADRCGKLSDRKEALQARMRNGYSGKAGERMQDTLRKIDGEYYDLRCGR